MIEYINGIPRADYLEIIRKTEEATEKRVNEYTNKGMYVTEDMKNTWYRMYSNRFEKVYRGMKIINDFIPTKVES